MISASSVLERASEVEDESFYKRRRYQLGIGEGTIDHPPGNSFPLESNAAFLNGGNNNPSLIPCNPLKQNH